MYSITADQRVGRRDKESASVTATGQNQQNNARTPECVRKLNQLPGSYFSSYLKDRPNTRCRHILLMHELSQLSPTTNLEASNASSLLCTYPRTFSASPSPTLCISASVNSLHSIYIFRLQTHYIEEPRQPQDGAHLASPPSPADDDLDCMPQDPVLFLDKAKDKNVGTRI